MKVSKKLLLFLSPISIISLLGLGFSTWVVNNQAQQNLINNNMYVADVVSSTQSSFIYTRYNESVSNITYYKRGYVNDLKVISSSKNVTIPLQININNCKAAFPEQNDMFFNISFSYTNNYTSFNMFSNDDNHSFDCFIDCAYSDINYSEISGLSNFMYNFTINFSDLLSSNLNSLDLNIILTFDATIGTFFENNVFPCLEATNIKVTIE